MVILIFFIIFLDILSSVIYNVEKIDMKYKSLVFRDYMFHITINI